VTLIYLAIGACTAAIYAALLVIISWKMTMLVASVLLVVSGWIRVIAHRSKAIGDEMTRANAALSERMVEGYYGMKLIHSFGHEAHEQRRFDRASREVARLGFKQGLLQGAVTPAYEIFAAALLVAIIFSALHARGQLSALLVFIFVLYRLQPRIQNVDTARAAFAAL